MALAADGNSSFAVFLLVYMELGWYQSETRLIEFQSGSVNDESFLESCLTGNGSYTSQIQSQWNHYKVAYSHACSGRIPFFLMVVGEGGTRLICLL